MAPERDSTEAFERRLEEAGRQHYVLRLFVAGVTARSRAALERTRAICEEHLAGRYELEVIDIHQHPDLAREHQIVATPTLVKVSPLPLRRLVGALLETEQVLRGLNVARRN
jgi:circadian clock protein KaiB